MKKQKQMQKAFGINEFGQADLPVKISNVQISRITYGPERGCSWCFPHGFETSNSTISNRQRNWKRFRRTRWKSSKKKGRTASAFFVTIHDFSFCTTAVRWTLLCGHHPFNDDSKMYFLANKMCSEPPGLFY